MRATRHFTKDTVLETLRLTRVWSTAPPDVLERAARRVEVLVFPDGEALIRQGEPSEALHVIVEGRVEVRVHPDEGSVVALYELGEGESIGEMSLLTGDPSSADVVAVGRVVTLAITASDFTDVVAADQEVLRQVVHILSGRLSKADVAVGVAREKEQDLTQYLREGDDWVDDLQGNSGPIKKLRKAIAAYAPGSAPVLVRGEQGTRRAVVARLLHRQSERGAALVLGVDCSLIVETPWGDQLCSAPGARAVGGRALCYLEVADGGTLILKDLERLPPPVQHRLAKVLREEAPRYDTRIVATCPDGDANRVRIAPELLACFDDRVLEVPPLRERKRDIPLLAQHDLEKHAFRMGKDVRSLTDPAITRLVSYDYRIANDRELEEAIERAVILTDEEEVEAEALFLGAPSPPRPGALNLLKIPGLDVRRLSRWLPRVLRIASVLFIAFILALAFFGPKGEDGNLATTLVWSLWWPALVLSFFFVGRAWCAICPMSVASKVTSRFRPEKRRIPTWLKKHDVAVAMVGLFLIVLVEETTDMRHSPVATGLLLLTIFAGAAITGLLLPRRSWCRHICPLGGLAGVCATSGVVELRPTLDICAAKCKGHACYKGDGDVEGCPMFNHVMFVDTNQHCVLCMKCVQSCPNGSPQLNLRLPGREIWNGAAANPSLGLFVLMLTGLIAGMTVVQHLDRAGGVWDDGGTRALVVGLILLVGAAVPLLLARARLRVLDARGPEAVAAFWRHVVALTPVVTAGLVAYQLEYLPGLGWLEASLHTSDAAGGDSWLSLSLLSIARLLVLAAGFLTSAVILRRAHLRSTPEEASTSTRRARAAPWLATLVGYTTLLLVLMIGS